MPADRGRAGRTRTRRGRQQSRSNLRIVAQYIAVLLYNSSPVAVS